MDAQRFAGTHLDMGMQQGKAYAEAMHGGLESFKGLEALRTMKPSETAIGNAPPVLEGENLIIQSLGECMQFTGKTHVFDTRCNAGLDNWTMDGVPADRHGAYCTTTNAPAVSLNAISLDSVLLVAQVDCQLGREA